MATKETGPLWLQIARNELGQKEVVGKKDNPRVVQYHQATTLKASDDETPWCSSFVCWCLELSGEKSSRSAAARSYLKWGKPVKDFPIGAIVVLHRGQPAWQGHVGFIVGSDKDTVTLVSGNSSNSVRVSKYLKANILGVRWPAKV